MQESKIKSANLSSSKNAKEESQEIQRNIESKISLPSQYIIDPNEWGKMNDRERKSFRRKKRSLLNQFKDNILGKDRSEGEKKKSAIAFKKYFRDNYLAKELDSYAIYSGGDQKKRSEYEMMIKEIERLCKRNSPSKSPAKG